MSDADNPYDASHIQVLEGLEAVRKRPGMYVGSTGRRGLHQMVFDVVGRAVNEVLAGRVGAVDVTLTADGGVRVADDGPGVPFEAAGGTGGPGLEALLTQLHAGSEPGGRHAVAMSLGGVGPCVTNALSSRLRAEVRRKGVHWVQEYARGVALTPPTSAEPTTGGGPRSQRRSDRQRSDGGRVGEAGPARVHGLHARRPGRFLSAHQRRRGRTGTPRRMAGEAPGAGRGHRRPDHPGRPPALDD